MADAQRVLSMPSEVRIGNRRLKRSLLPSILIAWVSFAPAAMSAEAQAQGIEWEDPTQEVPPAFDSLDVELEQVTLQKLESCMSAFADEKFCSCLSSGLPIGITFDGYIQAVTRTKAEIGYNDLSENEKTLIDMARSVRDQCVAAKKKK